MFSDKLLATIAEKVLTEAGLVAALCLAALVWMARLLKTEREDRKEATKKTADLAEQQAKANLASSTVLLEMKTALTLLAERLR